MSPIQQMLLGVGAVATKTYVDDVFSTFLYEGISSTKTITNGIDLAGEGGMVWFKSRSHSQNHTIYDTVRGIKKSIMSDDSGAQTDETSSSYFGIDQFNNNGFRTGYYNPVNSASKTYASWTFRKSPGFFDVVTYTGNGTAGRQLSHNLGCAPGMVAIKCTSDSHNWTVWHRGLSSNGKTLQLNSNSAEFTADDFNALAPSSSVIHLSSTNNSNGNGKTYVAYLFAGGKSTAATARSVDFDGTGDYLTSTHGSAGSSDFSMGTGDFTIECWVKKDATAHQGFYQISPNTAGYTSSNFGNTIGAAYDGTGWTMVSGGSSGNDSTPEPVTVGAWYHIAHVRYNGVTKLYVNGTEKISITDTYNYDGYTVAIGIYYSTGFYLDGNISNFRIVKGTAVYTSSFRPPTEPLTNITNTKLLCCNNSSTTGSTVTSGTITAHGDPTASTDSGFDDPAGFVFGDAGDQNVIKCGSYVGNGSATGPEINLGFEPQWIMVKSASGSEGWLMFDVMRGIVSGGEDAILKANNTDTESGSNTWLDTTSTGFRITRDSDSINKDGDTYIFMCLRRSDGYVGKPPELGTDVFSLGTRSGSSSNALAAVNTLVDFSIIKNYGAGEYWAVNARLTGKYSLKTNSTSAQLQGALPTSGGVWDRMLGHLVAASNGATNSPTGNMVDYGWKRHAGFDLVNYKGNDAVRWLPHNLNAVPQMIWVKRRTPDTGNWWVYHVGANGGTNPEGKELVLNTSAAEVGTNFWAVPTSTHFYIGGSSHINDSSNTHLVCLFASVDGISSVGSYSGVQDAAVTVTTGFSPRFIIVKARNYGSSIYDWFVFDTVRGFGSGDDKYLRLNDNTAQGTTDVGTVSSTGFTLNEGAGWNMNNREYIYYAHA